MSFKYVLFDIDDTITAEGKLPPCSYQSLWDLHENGFVLVAVTGRPAGWCDLIIRQWPVNAVIGENGAFYFYAENNTYSVITHPNAVSNKGLEKLEKIVLESVPMSRPAKDQFSRLYDLAIDFCEDEPRLPIEEAYKIADICINFGAKAKVSSIHVNTWLGDYDKLSMTKIMFENVFNETDFNSKCVYFGDSPNDEPMFQFFYNTIGVANVKPFLERMTFKPKKITNKPGGFGFTEAVRELL